jgi:hypothetical protein
VRIYLRLPLVLDSTLFVCAYLVLAALIALPFDYYVGYIQPNYSGWSHQSLPNALKGDDAQLVVRLVLASLLIWIPYRLIASSPRRWWLYCTLALIPFAFLAQYPTDLPSATPARDRVLGPIAPSVQAPSLALDPANATPR